MQREQPDRGVGSGDQDVDAGVIDTTHPEPRASRPVHPVVERARRQHHRHGSGERGGRHRSASTVGAGDQERPDDERNRQADLVKHPAEQRLGRHQGVCGIRDRKAAQASQFTFTPGLLLCRGTYSAEAVAADNRVMFAYLSPPEAPAARRWRVHPRRLLLAAPAVAAVAGLDLHVKAAALAAGGTGVDVPTSVARTAGAAAIGLLALLSIFVLPRLCLPGAVLFAGGAVSNLVSLGIWGGVPDPFELAVAGGVLHCNLADCCVWAGSVLFLVSALWILWRMPGDDFARLMDASASGRSPTAVS